MKKNLNSKVDLGTRFFCFKNGYRIRNYELFSFLDKSKTKDRDVHVFPNFDQYNHYISLNTNTSVSKSVLSQSVLRISKNGSVVVSKKDCDTLINMFNVDSGIELGTPEFQEIIDEQKKRVKGLILIPRQEWNLMTLGFRHWD